MITPCASPWRKPRPARPKTIRAKYVAGCDGARSRVREAIGAAPQGDFANHAWGVVDMLAETDFPDIRLKAAIQSADHGNILLIPREGGYLVRLYVDLGEIDPANREALRLITQDQVIQTAQRVLHPYTLEVRSVAWFAVYQVGQRVTDRFDDVAPGAAEDPAAARVHCGRRVPHAQRQSRPGHERLHAGRLQSRLEARRRAGGPRPARSCCGPTPPSARPVAQRLIDFDKEWSKIMASPPKNPAHPERGGVDPAELQAYFVMSGRYNRRRGHALPAGDLPDRRSRPSSTGRGVHHRDALPLGPGGAAG